MDFLIDNLCIISQSKADCKNVPELASKHWWWNTCALDIHSSKEKNCMYLHLQFPGDLNERGPQMSVGLTR